MIENLLPVLLLAVAIGGPALIFVLFLRFFRKTRLTFGSCITCPEKKHRANVRFVARFGEKGPYRDVGSCSLLQEEKEVSCKKACLLMRDVLDAPFERREESESRE